MVGNHLNIWISIQWFGAEGKGREIDKSNMKIGEGEKGESQA